MSGVDSAGALAGVRFQLVNALPALAGVTFVGLTLASGGFGDRASIADLRSSLDHLDLEAAGVVSLGVFVISLVLNSFQTRLVKVLEGYWRPVGLRMLLRDYLMRRQESRRRRFGQQQTSLHDPSRWHRQALRRLSPDRRDAASADLRDWARQQLDRLPPLPTSGELDRIMPTRLGNALRRAEDFAGDRYGLPAVSATPYLLDLSSEPLRAAVDDAQTEIDVTTKFVFVWALCTGLGFGAFFDDGPWMLVPTATFTLCYVAYRASILAAESYGQMLSQLVDMHRFDLMQKLHWRLPDTHDHEVAENVRLWQLLNGEPESGVTYWHPKS